MPGQDSTARAAGADVSPDTRWFEDGYDSCSIYGDCEYCREFDYSGHFVYHNVATPSGIQKYDYTTHYVFAYRYWTTMISPGEVIWESSYSDDAKYSSSYLLRGNDWQQIHSVSMDSYEDDYQSCELKALYGLANGEMRVERFEMECVPK